MLGTAVPAFADGVALPSGLVAHLHEIIEETDDAGPVLRLRYVTGGDDPSKLAPDVALNDMAFLCRTEAIPRLDQQAERPTVVVSLADRAAPFGQMDADVGQIFEVFSVAENACIWEAF